MKNFCTLCLLFSLALLSSGAGAQIHPHPLPAASAASGIRFSCTPQRLAGVRAGMRAYLRELRVAPKLVSVSTSPEHDALTYTLNTPADDVQTLDFKTRPELHIRDEWVALPDGHGRLKRLRTVSMKEILLALLQHGRLTEFSGAACDIAALREHVALRQNTVAWAEHLTWMWPDGEAAQWNEQYWQAGTPKPGVPLHAALNDVFVHQDKYAIGCYTATKLVVVQGVLDYYRRVRRSPARLKLVEARLTADREPLAGIEPAQMWDFETDFDPQELNRPGKLLKIKQDVQPLNFVPGDWIYILNTDPVSYGKTGYEGSNAIYLGRNKFDDYYNDNHHAYTYQQKLNEVYQWRNGVFNRVRDAAKIQPLSATDIERLSQRPAQGGLLKALRVLPYFFAYEDLPEPVAP